MRVYELAKKLDKPNKELVTKLGELGYEKKTHSSSLDQPTLQALLGALGVDPAQLDTEPAPAPKPKPKTKAPEPQATPEPAPDKPVSDARSRALEALARAKAKRAKLHQQQQTDSPDTAPSLQAPEHQRVDLASSRTQQSAPPPPPPPSQAPAPQQLPPKQASPAPEAKTEQPAPTAPKPEKPRETKPPVIKRQGLELEQMPGLPKRKTPPAEERPGAAPGQPPELAIPPSIEVMKLKPARKTPRPDEDRQPKKRKLQPSKPAGGKKIRPGRFLNLDTLEETVQEGTPHGAKIKPGDRHKHRHQEQIHELPKAIMIQGDMTVGEFADKIGVQASEIIGKAMMLGQMLTINNLLSQDLYELLAEEFDVQIDVQPESDEHDVEKYLGGEDSEDQLAPRPPVVTVMGHVDHGKTSLLDHIRKTRVAEGEAGGITQHIGAYRVQTDRGELVFLDTPGHAAFTAMRARGAQVTDIVILIVAADDSIMPQTVEAIDHARAAKVPIIVAINKIDLPSANVQRCKNELMHHNLISEDLGGDTIICEISSKTGEGIDNLLEMLGLQAEIMELKANPNRAAEGVIIESNIDPLRGTNATLLIKRGTLRHGDPFVCGAVSGRVRLMMDDAGHEVHEALPAHPVRILGLDGCPQVGEHFLVVESEREAREIAEVREFRRRRKSQDKSLRPHVTLEGLSDYLSEEGKAKELRIVLKADVQGSVEAVAQSLLKLATEKVQINILHSAVGSVNESDVQLAMASDALILGFSVSVDPSAADLAQMEGIEIRNYDVIYHLTEDIEKAMLGMLDKKYEEVLRGKAEIRQVFKTSRLGNIAGCYVFDGEIGRNDLIRVRREGKVVHEGRISSLKRHKDDVNSVKQNFDCGMTFQNLQDIQEGDIVEALGKKEVEQTL